MWYNDLRFGHPVVAAYGNVRYHTPLSTGLRGLLISPGKGRFVFNPLAIAGLIGLVRMGWNNRALAGLMALLIVARVVLFAESNAPFGAL